MDNSNRSSSDMKFSNYKSVSHRHLHMGISGVPSVTLRVEEDISFLKVSYAICDPRDQFDRSVGRKISDETANFRSFKIFKYFRYYEDPIEVMVFNELKQRKEFGDITRSEDILLDVINDNYISQEREEEESENSENMSLMKRVTRKLLSIPVIQDTVLFLTIVRGENENG